MDKNNARAAPQCRLILAKGQENKRLLAMDRMQKLGRMRRRRTEEGISYMKLAKAYRVSFTAVYFAVNGRTWKHVGKV